MRNEINLNDMVYCQGKVGLVKSMMFNKNEAKIKMELENGDRIIKPIFLCKLIKKFDRLHYIDPKTYENICNSLIFDGTREEVISYKTN